MTDGNAVSSEGNLTAIVLHVLMSFLISLVHISIISASETKSYESITGMFPVINLLLTCLICHWFA